MPPMPKPRPPNLHREITRHGETVWYYRRAKGPRIRILGAYGSAEFQAAYAAALVATMPPRSPRAAVNSLAWLVARYQDTAAWARLASATKRQRENIFRDVCKSAGEVPFTDITAKMIRDGVERRARTPFSAVHFLKAMRGLFKWAAEAELIASDPAAGVKFATPRTEGYHTWTDEEIAAFETRWPVGTKERLALSILLYTGLRRGDAAMLGRQHIRGGVVTFRTEKTGQQVTIPLLPELARIIDATPTGDLGFLGMSKDTFGKWFKRACKAAGVSGSAHGLRKAGATRAANNGATVAQLEAIFGWSGGRMASLYTRGADRVRLAKEAMEKLSK